MKKLYLLSLLLPLWGIAYSQSCVAVRQVSTNYATQQITFDLTWGTCNNTTHLNKAWVFVDYQTITGTTRGAWAPATIVGTPTVSNGTYAAGNSRGFYVTGNNGQTATVTVTLSGVPAQFNWCAIATDYPPNATINAAGGYALYGTAPFTVNGVQLGTGVRTYSGACITSITDPTGCPGLIPAAPTVTTTNPAAVCAGSGVTLVATPGGGTTTANTYTWNIGGASTTTTTNTFAVPAASITTSKTFTVSVTNANGCTSNPVSSNITVISGCGSGNGTSITNCSNPPSGFSFTSGFTSTSTWVVGSQTWSAPVTATYCNKATYNSPTSAPYAVDCRTNSTAGYGHLFSWCMIAKFATTICPSGWRVPTSTDFYNLDRALGGTGANGQSNTTLRNNYLNTWGGQYGGYSGYNGTLSRQGSYAYYWSQTEYNATNGYRLYFYSNGGVYPQNSDYKYSGFSLRCVK